MFCLQSSALRLLWKDNQTTACELQTARHHWQEQTLSLLLPYDESTVAACRYDRAESFVYTKHNDRGSQEKSRAERPSWRRRNKGSCENLDYAKSSKDLPKRSSSTRQCKHSLGSLAFKNSGWTSLHDDDWGLCKVHYETQVHLLDKSAPLDDARWFRFNKDLRSCY